MERKRPRPRSTTKRDLSSHQKRPRSSPKENYPVTKRDLETYPVTALARARIIIQAPTPTATSTRARPAHPHLTPTHHDDADGAPLGELDLVLAAQGLLRPRHSGVSNELQAIHQRICAHLWGVCGTFKTPTKVFVARTAMRGCTHGRAPWHVRASNVAFGD